jgi:hypothetical protein
MRCGHAAHVAHRHAHRIAHPIIMPDVLQGGDALRDPKTTPLFLCRIMTWTVGLAPRVASIRIKAPNGLGRA